MVRICFTGHRPDSLGGYDPNAVTNKLVYLWLELNIDKIINKFKEVEFISGGALGVDLWAAEIVLQKKNAGENVKLTMALPCHNQESKWPQESKDYYKNIIEQADKVVYTLNGPYNGPYCMQVRNEWMVNHSDMVIAVWNGTSGGTGNCVNYAMNVNKKILRFDPKEGVTSKLG